MEFIATYKKASSHLPVLYRLIVFVYADSVDQAKYICSKFYIEHYVFEDVSKSVNND